MGVNFYVPMWLEANEPLASRCALAHCKKEYIYCERCGGKMYRTHHKAYFVISTGELAVMGLSHAQATIEYEHTCQIIPLDKME